MKNKRLLNFILISFYFVLMENNVLSSCDNHVLQRRIKQIKQRCSHLNPVQLNDSTMTRLYFDEKVEQLIAGTSNRPLIIINDLSPFFADSINIYTFKRLFVLDGSFFSALVLSKKYGLILDLNSSNNIYAFNTLMLMQIPPDLLNEDSIKQFIDYYLRAGSSFYLGYYRINKYDDIWLFPQYFLYMKGRLSCFKNKSFSYLFYDIMVENMPADLGFQWIQLTKYPNYKIYSDRLENKITPIQINQNLYDIVVSTYIAEVYSGSIQLWTFTITRTGQILNVEKKMIKENVGISEFLQWGIMPYEGE